MREDGALMSSIAPATPAALSRGCGASATRVPVVMVECEFDAPNAQCLYPPAVVARAHVIVEGHGRTYHRNLGASPASINAVIKGEGTWATEGGHYVVRPGACLVLGEGDAGSLAIDSPTPIEAFCVSFRTGFLSGLGWELRSDVTMALWTTRTGHPARRRRSMRASIRPPTGLARHWSGCDRV